MNEGEGSLPYTEVSGRPEGSVSGGSAEDFCAAVRRDGGEVYLREGGLAVL